jgi:hypothetical protein
MKLYKVRIDSTDYEDIVVEAKSKEEAKELAVRQANFSSKEFCEFLEVEQDDIDDWKRWNK